MDDFQLCSSLGFNLTKESAIYDDLEDISLAYDTFFVFFLLYCGPVLVLANVFAIFILTSRKDLRTPYSIVFITMALDQGLAIVCRHVLTWNNMFFHFGCGFASTFAYQVLQMMLSKLCPMFGAHASWLAVIMATVRLRHMSAIKGEPSMRFMTALCCISFGIILVAGVPLFLSSEIHWLDVEISCDGEPKQLRSVPFDFESDRIYENDCLRIAYISSGLLYNALPCILLVFLSTALACRLRKISKDHSDMIGRSSSTSSDSARSTSMIILIVFSTLLTDVPPATLAILIGFTSDRFRTAIAIKLNSFLVSLVLIASLCNFITHVCMSKRFREVTLSYLCCVCRTVKSVKSSPIPRKY